MIELNVPYLYVYQSNRPNVHYVFLKEYETEYKVQWWIDGSNDKRVDSWHKRGVKKSLDDGYLQRDISKTEQAISKNYVI